MFSRRDEAVLFLPLVGAEMQDSNLGQSLKSKDTSRWTLTNAVLVFRQIVLSTSR